MRRRSAVCVYRQEIYNTRHLKNHIGVPVDPYSPLRHPFREHPLLRLVLPFMTGIVAGEYGYFRLGHHVGALWLAVAAVAVAGYALQICRPLFFRPSRIGALTVGLCALLAGAALCVSERSRTMQAWPTAVQSFRALVTDTPREGERTFQLTARLDGGPCDGRKVRLTLMKQSVAAGREAPASVHTGDVLLLRARMETPHSAGNPGEFDYAAWLRRQGIGGVAFCPSGQWCVSSAPAVSLPVVVRLRQWREQLSARYARYFAGRDLGVLSAMTLGDKAALDADTRAMYSRGGVSHILALSGLHLSILFALWNALVMPLTRRRGTVAALTALTGMGGLWLFVGLAGCPYSLVRAAVMFSVMQLAGLWRGDPFSLNNLALAALLILGVSPGALFDAGFQLSFLSVAGILLVLPRIGQPKVLSREAALHPEIVRRRLPRVLFLTGRFSRPFRVLAGGMFGLLTVSLTAQVVTMPLVAYYFHTVAPYGLLGNLVAVPAAYPLLFFSALFLLFPFLQPLLAPLLSLLLSMLHAVLEGLSALPGAGFALAPPLSAVVLCYAVLLLLLAAANLRRVFPVYVAAGALTLAVLLCLPAGSGAVHRQFVVFNLRGGATALGFRTAPRQACLWSPDTLRADSALTFLRRSSSGGDDLAMAPWHASGRPVAGFYAAGGLLATAGLRVAVASGPFKAPAPRLPLPVDYLVVARGYRRPLSDALLRYRPRVLVLDASLGEYHRERLTAEARRARLCLYDVERQGALVVDLP